MKKTMTAFIAAALTAAAMLTPASANSLYQEVDPLSDYVSNMLEGYTEVENIHLFDALTWNGTEYRCFEKLYVNDEGTKFIGFERLNFCDIMFSLADGIDKEAVEKALLDEFLSEYEDAHVWLSQDEESEKLYHFSCYGKGCPKFDTVKYAEIIEFLKGKGYITAGELIINNKYSVFDIYLTDISYYNANYWKYNDDGKISATLKNKDRMKDFVESELEGYRLEEVEADSDGVSERYLALVPPDGVSLTDKLETAEKVYQATGAAPYFESPENAKEIINADSIIDVFGAVKGDSNCDGKATIADSVAILQSIANKDKYALSAQGKFNGDVDGVEGVTANDARVLQEWDANK